MVEVIIHSDIPNYTKLAFNGLKMIQNDAVSQPIKQGDDRPLMRAPCAASGVWRMGCRARSSTTQAASQRLTRLTGE